MFTLNLLKRTNCRPTIVELRKKTVLKKCMLLSVKVTKKVYHHLSNVGKLFKTC